MKELEKWIDETLPGEAGWWSGGNEEFSEQAKVLLDKGLSVEEIKGIFESLYSAVAGEFGN